MIRPEAMLPSLIAFFYNWCYVVAFADLNDFRIF
jgi:hypothetical protein